MLIKNKKNILWLTIFFNLLHFTSLILFLFIISLTSCSASDSDSFTFPQYNYFVNDYAGVLSEEWHAETENLVQKVREETSCEIAVAVVDSLEGLTIEEYAFGLFNDWGIGKKDIDNGVLLLVAIEDRRIRIEVGYGLEPVVTDLKAKNIIDEVITPRFKKNDYDSGIYNGVVAIANLIYEDLEKNPMQYSDSYQVSGSGEKESSGSPAFVIVIVILANFLPWAAVGLAFGITALRHYIKTHRCPQCKKIALVIKTKILSYATYEFTGRAHVEKYCRKCSFTEKSTITLPILRKRSYSGTGSSGHSFSSGSSSSSHSSSSFGGGSSGGGGASGSW